MNYYDYDVIQSVNNMFSPNTIKAKNNNLYMFFARYLWQKAASVFKWTLPENWSLIYFIYVLYAAGYIAILDTDEYDVIPQFCTFNGKRTVFFEPQGIIVTNHAFQPEGKVYERKLGVDAVLIRLMPDYHGIGDIIGYYADQMALAAEAVGVNLINTKTAEVFAASNKTAAESFKKMFDEISAGNPAVFIDKDLYNDDGDPAWIPFISNLSQQFITPSLIQTLADLESQFDAYIGMPNVNGMEKKERLITDEVNMNNVSTYSRVELWKDTIDKGIKEANSMFNLNLKCEWRHEPPSSQPAEEPAEEPSDE